MYLYTFSSVTLSVLLLISYVPQNLTMGTGSSVEYPDPPKIGLLPPLMIADFHYAGTIEQAEDYAEFIALICSKPVTDESKEEKIKKATVTIRKKKYQCSLSTCTKAFKYKSSLETHLRSHTGEKPFSCDRCNSRFTDKSSWRRHQRLHDNRQLFQCPRSNCQKYFSRKDQFKTHMINCAAE